MVLSVVTLTSDSDWLVGYTCKLCSNVINQGRRRHNLKFILKGGVFFPPRPYLFFLLFSIPFLPFPLSFPLRSGPSNPVKGFGGALLAPHSKRKRQLQPPYVLLALNTPVEPRSAFCGVFRAQGMCLVVVNVVLYQL